MGWRNLGVTVSGTHARATFAVPLTVDPVELHALEGLHEREEQNSKRKGAVAHFEPGKQRHDEAKCREHQRHLLTEAHLRAPGLRGQQSTPT